MLHGKENRMMKKTLWSLGLLTVLSFARPSAADVAKSTTYLVDSGPVTVPGLAQGGVAEVRAYCNNPSDILISGGCWNWGGSPQAVVLASFPQPNGGTTADFWYCAYKNTASAPNLRVYARAYCYTP
jgi:hypothetical protein